MTEKFGIHWRKIWSKTKTLVNNDDNNNNNNNNNNDNNNSNNNGKDGKEIK